MRRAHRVGFVALVVAGAAGAAIALYARGATADEARVPLTVRRTAAASSCPDAGQLAAEVRRLTTKVTLDADATDTDATDGGRIQVDFTHGPSGFRAQIRATGERSGVRVLAHNGATCAPLAEAASVSLAVLLDPEWRPPEPPAPPPPPPPPPPIAEPTPAEAEKPTPASPGRAWEVRVSASGGAAIGVVRAAAPIFDLGVAFDPFPELSVAARAVLVPAQSLALGPGHVDVSLAGGALEACVLPLGSSRVRVGVCAEALLGAVSARGVGYFRDGATTRPWLAFGGHAHAHGAIAGPLGWTARAGALAPTTTEGFGVDGAGVAYDPPRVAIVLAAGLSMTFR